MGCSGSVCAGGKDKVLQGAASYTQLCPNRRLRRAHAAGSTAVWFMQVSHRRSVPPVPGSVFCLVKVSLVLTCSCHNPLGREGPGGVILVRSAGLGRPPRAASQYVRNESKVTTPTCSLCHEPYWTLQAHCAHGSAEGTQEPILCHTPRGSHYRVPCFLRSRVRPSFRGPLFP